MSALLAGCLRTEECAFHKQVVWEFDYPQKDVYSPIFEDGHQKYEMRFHERQCLEFSIHLYSVGPTAKRSPKGRVRWCAGLKRPCGSYYHRIGSGNLVWKKERWPVCLKLLEGEEVESQSLARNGRLTVFLRLSSRQDSPTARFCIHGSPSFPIRGEGMIREMEENSSMEVEWSVALPPPYYSTGWLAASPEFKFGDQRFLLEFTMNGPLELHLFRIGPSARVRWWAGLKRADGSYYHRIETGKREFDSNGLWRKEQLLFTVNMRFSLFELAAQDLIRGSHVTFFVLFTKATTGPSFLGFSWFHVVGTGSIREEEFTTHKEVEWQVHQVPQDNYGTVSSPEFGIGGQSFLLELSKTSVPSLDLYRVGPSVKSPVWFWAGIKKFDGTYHRSYEKGTLDLKKDCPAWTKMKGLCTFRDLDEDEKLFTSPFPVTLFFRVSLKRTHSGFQFCIDGSDGESTGVDGVIREEDCPSHKYVEWEVTYKQKNGLKSPSFGMGNQRYLLDLQRLGLCGPTMLNLNRVGPRIRGSTASVRWCVGMNCGKGTYGYRNQSGKLNLKEECKVWRRVSRLRSVSEEELASGGPLIFSLWLSLQRPSTSLVDACSHGSRMMSWPRAGSVVEETWPSYKLVEWDIGCGLTQAPDKILTSPDFSIGNQRFVLDLWCGKDYRIVQLFRMGPSEYRSAPWILGAKDRAGTYDESKCGKLDLKEAYQIWSKVEHICFYGKFEQDKRNYLTVSFLMSLERTSTATVVRKKDVAALQNSQFWGREDVVFKVQGKEFKVHRAVFRIRVPALDAMFKYDTLEGRTGVVRIEDCDSAVFKIFLKYVVTGELQFLTTDESFALYALADKYLMKQFRLRCLRRIQESLSADSFCHVFEFIFRYGDEDLLQIASQFLNRNNDIVQSDVWQNFRSEYPNAACSLETEVVQNGSLK